jgi:hypothetical protein
MSLNSRLLVSSAAVMSTGLVVVAKPGRMRRSAACVSSASGCKRHAGFGGGIGRQHADSALNC